MPNFGNNFKKIIISVWGPIFKKNPKNNQTYKHTKLACHMNPE